MKTKIYCPDIECDSCVKLISRGLEKVEGVENYTINKDSVEIFHIDNVSPESLISMINERGFRAALEPFERKTFRERLRDFTQNKHKYEIERSILKYSGLTLLILIILEAIAYFGFFKTHNNFLSNYGWWIFYTNLAIISIGSAVLHIKSYRMQVTSMVGMMIGMTFGMQTGMLIGTILGATNGLFIGGTTGMLLAVAVGFYNGKCCGIMGVMEGIMAGIMGGLMGAMIGAMFLLDHIFYFMPVYVFVNMIVMWGLSYMLYEEVVENNPKTRKTPVDFTTFASFVVVIVAIILTIMIYGPKTGIAGAVLGGV